MTFFEYIKNEATVEQIAHMFNELVYDVCEAFDDWDYDENTFVNAIKYVTDKDFKISSNCDKVDFKTVEMLNFDIDEYHKISKEIKELHDYIIEIKEALKNEDEDKLYELVNIVIHKYKDYITIDGELYKRINFEYYEHGFHCYERIISVNSKIYEKMIAND
jgi:hypothetical protein